MLAPDLHDVCSLLHPMLILPLDFIAERDPALAERIDRDATAVTTAIAAGCPASATARAARLRAWVHQAFFAGRLDFDGTCDLDDLLACVLAALHRHAAREEVAHA